MLLFCVRQASDVGTLVLVVSHDGEKILNTGVTAVKLNITAKVGY